MKLNIEIQGIRIQDVSIESVKLQGEYAPEEYVALVHEISRLLQSQLPQPTTEHTYERGELLVTN